MALVLDIIVKDKGSQVIKRFSTTVQTEQKKVRAGSKQTTKQITSDWQRVGSRIKDMVGPLAALALAFKAISFSKEAIELSRDAEETGNKFNQVFKGIRDESKATTDALKEDFKLATSTSQELLSGVGDLLVGLKLTRSEALQLADKVVRLSSDVASFKNIQGGAERATNALTKALLGEREMLKDTFSTAVLEAEVTVRANKLMAERTELTQQQLKTTTNETNDIFIIPHLSIDHTT